jgi:hypothetical protein
MSPTSRKGSFAEGSSNGRTPESACCRAVYEYITLRLKAEKLAEKLDDITMPDRRNGLDLNDSLVIALQDFGAADE